jgi:hypothetical protein
VTLHHIHQFDGCVLWWLRELDIPKLEVLWDGDVFIRPVIDNNVRPIPLYPFQVLYRSDKNAGHFDPENLPEFPANPVRRDVVLVNGLGFAIIAFRADNPGTWFLYVLVALVLIVLVIVILIGTLSRGWSRRLLRRLLRCRKDWLFLRSFNSSA